MHEDKESLERLANVGELAGVLAHEFADFLNVLLLQISVLETSVPKELRSDLAEVRRQGKRASELVNQFHAYRRGRLATGQTVDLAEAVSKVEQELVAEGVVLQAEGAGEPRLVSGPGSDVQRLVRFLARNAWRAGEGRPVRVATEAEAGVVRLVVEDAGATPSTAQLEFLFHPTREPRAGVEALELAACPSLARRLGATVRAEAVPQGGLRVIVEFRSR